MEEKKIAKESLIEEFLRENNIETQEDLEE